MLLGLTLVSLADALDLGEAARRLEGCAQLLLETRDGGRHEARSFRASRWFRDGVVSKVLEDVNTKQFFSWAP